MKRNILINAAAIICMALVSCTINVDGETVGGETIKGNGNIVTRNYDMGAFDEISISLPATVNFTVSNNYTCTVRVDENLINYIEITVNGRDLQMKKTSKHKKDNLLPTEFVIEISAPSLEEINLAGNGSINVLSPLQGGKLEVSLAGLGDVILNEPVNLQKLELNIAGSGSLVCNELVADKLECNVAGSGDLKVLSGTVFEADVDIAGTGDCNLSCDLENLEANIAGTGDITAKVSGYLDYSIIGSGNISYYGNPVVKGGKLGRGKVERLGD